MRHRKSENWDVDIFSGFSHFTTLIYLKEICTWDDYILEKPLLLGVVNGEYRLRNISEQTIWVWICFELFDVGWTMFTY